MGDAEAIRDAAMNSLADDTNSAVDDVNSLVDESEIYSVATKSLDKFVENLSVDVVIPERTWDARFWQKYIASYGVALGELNIGSARAMQKDLNDTSTDCFKRAIITANAVKTMFDLNYYENNSLNIPDIYNFISVVSVKYTDQFQSC